MRCLAVVVYFVLQAFPVLSVRLEDKDELIASNSAKAGGTACGKCGYDVEQGQSTGWEEIEEKSDLYCGHLQRKGEQDATGTDLCEQCLDACERVKQSEEAEAIARKEAARGVNQLPEVPKAAEEDGEGSLEDGGGSLMQLANKFTTVEEKAVLKKLQEHVRKAGLKTSDVERGGPGDGSAEWVDDEKGDGGIASIDETVVEVVEAGKTALEKEMRQQIGDRTKVVIVGGTSWNFGLKEAGGPEISKQVAQELKQLTCADKIAYITGGNPAVQQTFAESYGDAKSVFNVLVGKPSGFKEGSSTDLTPKLTNIEELHDVLSAVGDIYISVGGGPGVQSEVEAALERDGVRYIPVVRTGGSSKAFGGVDHKQYYYYHYIDAKQWEAISDANAEIKDTAVAIAQVVAKLVASNSRIACSAGKHGDPASTDEKEEELGDGSAVWVTNEKEEVLGSGQ